MSNSAKSSSVQPLRIADAARAVRHVFIRNLMLDAHIGAYRHEVGSAQPIRVNIDLTVSEDGAPVDDRLENVVDYAEVAKFVRNIVDRGHVNLVETLAETVASHALTDPRVRAVRVRIEKMAALPDAESVGVEIERLANGI